jgi:hypothetical protein
MCKVMCIASRRYWCADGYTCVLLCCAYSYYVADAAGAAAVE